MLFKYDLKLLILGMLSLVVGACGKDEPKNSVDALVDAAVMATKDYVNEASEHNLNALINVFEQLKQSSDGLEKLSNYQEKNANDAKQSLSYEEDISAKIMDNDQSLALCSHNTYGELIASAKMVDSLIDRVMKDYFMVAKDQLLCSNSVVWTADRLKDEDSSSRLKFFLLVVQISPELVNDFKKDNDFKEDVVLQVLKLLPDEQARLALIAAMTDSNKSEVFQEEAKNPGTYDYVISKLQTNLVASDQKIRIDIVNNLSSTKLPPPPIDYVIKLATEHGVEFTKMIDPIMMERSSMANLQEVVDLVHDGDVNMGFPPSPGTTEAEIKLALKTLTESLDEYKSLGLPKFFYLKNNTPTSLNAKFKIGRAKMTARAGSIDWMHELDQVGATIVGYQQASHALPLSFYEDIFNEIVSSHVLDNGSPLNPGKVVVGGAVLGDTTRYTEGAGAAHNNNLEAKKNSTRSFLMGLANKTNVLLPWGTCLRLNNLAPLNEQNFKPQVAHRDLYNELSYKLFRIVEKIRSDIALNNTTQEKFDRWKILAEPLLHAGENCANAKSNTIDDAYRDIAEVDYKRLFGGLMTSAVGDANKILQLTAFIKEALLKEAVEKVLIIPVGQPGAGGPVYEAASKRVKTWNTLAPLIGINNKSGPEYLASSIADVDFMNEFLGDGSPGNGMYTPEKLLTELSKKAEFLAMVQATMGDLYPLMRHYEDRVLLERFLAIALLLKHGFLEKI